MGETTVVYAVTKDERPEARAARFFSIVVGLGAGCSANSAVAARFVIPPPPFGARLASVRRQQLPPSEPAGLGPAYKRLYLVSSTSGRATPSCLQDTAIRRLDTAIAKAYPATFAGIQRSCTVWLNGGRGEYAHSPR